MGKRNHKSSKAKRPAAKVAVAARKPSPAAKTAKAAPARSAPAKSGAASGKGRSGVTPGQNSAARSGAAVGAQTIGGGRSRASAKSPALDRRTPTHKDSSAPRSAERSNSPSKAAVEATSKSRARKMTVRAKTSEIVLPSNYHPSEDEPFMNDRQRAYFRQKLVAWKEEIVRQTKETLAGLHEDSSQHADLADRATSETDRALELRARDRQRKLVSKIDAALSRIEDGTYGYCEETGEPIGLKRLDARPIATLSLEAQERHERRERVYRED